MQKTEITVVDSIMGSGKTSWAIQYMNEHPENSFLFITPFLSEVNRIIDSTYQQFWQPKNLGKGKLDSLNDMLAGQINIASTHSLFQNLSPDSQEVLRESHYTLILDEVLSVVEPYDGIKADDLKLLRDSGRITIDDEGFLCWNEDKLDYDMVKDYNKIKNLAINRSLLYVNKRLLLWHYPVQFFALFDKVIVMTYMFDASILKNYFDLYNLQYSTKSIKTGKNGYELTDYFKPDISIYREKVHIYEGKLNDNVSLREYGLSVTWFRSQTNKDKINVLKGNLYNYFRNILKAKSDSIMWTSLKESRSKLKGNGYTKGYIPCNCRSTNDYGDRYNLAYCLNIYCHPAVSQFFLQHGIEIDQDKYALSELLQWIWRSRIRHGKSINIYIPSPRMRQLLNGWLKGDLADQTC